MSEKEEEEVSWTKEEAREIALHNLADIRQTECPLNPGWIPGLRKLITNAGLTLEDCGTSDTELEYLEHKQRLLACEGALCSLRAGRPDYWTPHQLFTLLREELGSGHITQRELGLSEREYAELGSKYGG